MVGDTSILIEGMLPCLFFYGFIIRKYLKPYLLRFTCKAGSNPPRYHWLKGYKLHLCTTAEGIIYKKIQNFSEKWAGRRLRGLAEAHEAP
jgi:hypothetical protein